MQEVCYVLSYGSNSGKINSKVINKNKVNKVVIV